MVITVLVTGIDYVVLFYFASITFDCTSCKDLRSGKDNFNYVEDTIV